MGHVDRPQRPPRRLTPLRLRLLPRMRNKRVLPRKLQKRLLQKRLLLLRKPRLQPRRRLRKLAKANAAFPNSRVTATAMTSTTIVAADMTAVTAVKKSYCKECKCLDPKFKKQDSSCAGSCGNPSYKGDGNCDDENNNCGCQYDGGDCC